ncbi:MAG TPA: SCO1664 family protein [Candidatus Limnocylindrales bacterium]
MAETRAGEPQADGPMIAGMTRSEIEAAAMEGRQIAAHMDKSAAMRLLHSGELTVVGRLLTASNATFFCVVESSGDGGDRPLAASCVYKPIRGERPLYDFPDGTLACREVGAHLMSEASGWDLIPPTVMRDGPFGEGMVQLWVEVDESVDLGLLISTDNKSLRRMAVLDAVLNNADRKGGHLLPLPDGRVQGCDNGLCFAMEPKLRTILWRWRGKRLRVDELVVLERLRDELSGDLGAELAALLSPDEVAATVARIETLLRKKTMPRPDPNRPAIPWPPY